MTTSASALRPYEGRTDQRATLRAAGGGLIGRYVAGAVVGISSGKPGAAIPDELECEVRMLNELTWGYDYSTVPSISILQEGQREVIRTLFTRFMKAARLRRTAYCPPATSSGSAVSKRSTQKWRDDVLGRLVKETKILVDEDGIGPPPASGAAGSGETDPWRPLGASGLRLQLPPTRKQPLAPRQQRQAHAGDHREGDPRAHVGDAQEAVADRLHDVEERVHVGELLPR